MVGEEQSQRVYSFENLLEEQGYIVYTNVGTSMLPLLRQRRDIIEIRKKEPNVRCRKYDAVLYKVEKRYILHRIIKVLPDSYVIVGDHCIYREYGIRDEQILGIMTRVIRDGKDIRVTDWKYQLVCASLVRFLSDSGRNSVWQKSGLESMEKAEAGLGFCLTIFLFFKLDFL